MTTPYAPPKTPQIDGSAFEDENCTWAATNDHIDAATLGRRRPGAAQLRRDSGDTSGGSSYSQNADVAIDYGVKLEPRILDERAKFRDGVASGRRASASIDCRITVTTSRRTNYFTGTHTVFVTKYRYCKAGGLCKCERRSSRYGHGEFLTEDPGTTSTGYQWWSATLMYRAMESRAAMANLPSGSLICMFGPDTEGVKRTTRQSYTLRTAPSTGASSAGSVAADVTVTVVSTANGGAWDVDGPSRPSTRTSNGWAFIRLSSGKTGWAIGRVVF